jgi:2-dehydropantoate 2-reductase
VIIGIVGAGAVGGYYGAVLKRAGFDVFFLARGKHLNVMENQGLHIESDHGAFQIEGTFTKNIEDLAQADFLLFTVKSTETKETALNLRSFLKAGSTVLTLQNGVDNEEILSDLLGRERVLSGAAYISSKVEAPGIIRQEGANSLLIGALADSSQQKAEVLADLFQTAGINCKLTNHILERKWDKLLWNVTFNPLSAAAMASVGEILDDQNLRSVAQRALLEAVEVGRASGVELRQKVIDRVFPTAEYVKNHKTSMLQDREQGKRMEVESLCGFLVRQGELLGIKTSVLSTLYAVLSSLDNKRGNRE